MTLCTAGGNAAPQVLITPRILRVRGVGNTSIAMYDAASIKIDMRASRRSNVGDSSFCFTVLNPLGSVSEGTSISISTVGGLKYLIMTENQIEHIGAQLIGISNLRGRMTVRYMPREPVDKVSQYPF